LLLVRHYCFPHLQAQRVHEVDDSLTQFYAHDPGGEATGSTEIGQDTEGLADGIPPGDVKESSAQNESTMVR